MNPCALYTFPLSNDIEQYNTNEDTFQQPVSQETGCHFYSITSSLIFTAFIFPETKYENRKKTEQISVIGIAKDEKPIFILKFVIPIPFKSIPSIFPEKK